MRTINQLLDDPEMSYKNEHQLTHICCNCTPFI